ncbi:uncharacterized protein LOC135693396 [Rhopilema esculentum]|uniref:uncharacterized protein LOC135693396 n=1 Tax=Rhopilema esculentum TaxID=499914 RepID=UPI0031E26ECB
MEKGGCKFGWNTIIEMWQRECTRVETGIMRKVPKLLPSFIECDAWTKLNVAPAKIMQQDNVLTDLYDHANPQDVAEKPKDFEATVLVRNYLLACNKIFERGVLSNSKITSSDLTIVNNIEDGYQFFEEWWEKLNAGGDFQPQSSAERRFISWQTWDLLRILVYGFTGLVKRFLHDYNGYYIFPLKVNGSAAETLFSQFKFETNIKLSSVNYATARSRVLMKKWAALAPCMEVPRLPMATGIHRCTSEKKAMTQIL